MSEPAILVEGLRKRFGDVEALAGVDFAVEPGTVLGLLGPNGAGKTTAVRVLTTTLLPDSGTARVLGLDVVRRATDVRDVIGLAGQYAAVDDNLTGRENLRLIARLTHLPRAAITPRGQELLEQFGLADAADRPVRTYSGGMRRRLDLAAALVHNPPVLFLDEPTTGLDIQSRSDLWEVIAGLVGSGTTVLLTTQYLEEADRLADQIVVIDHGSVIAAGTPAELKARLGATVVELGLPDEQSAARACEVVAPFGVLPCERAGHVVHLEVDQGPRVLIEVLRALDDAGLNPASLTVREPSLDDVFLALTGRPVELAEVSDDAPAAAKTRGAS